MLPCSLKCLYLCLPALITILVDQSSCHQPFSRRGTPSFSAFSHHRFARRSTPRLPNLARRSIDDDQLETRSESLDQQRDQAENMWEEFVESFDGEDIDSYPDCDELDESTYGPNSFPTPTKDSRPAQPVNLVQSGKPTTSTPNSLDSTSSTGQDQTKPTDDGRKAKEDADAKKQTQDAAAAADAEKKRLADQAAQDKEDKKHQDAESKKQHDADAKKQQDADAKKQQDADAKKQQDADAKKQQDADAKKQQDADAKKQQEAAAAEAKKQQEAAAAAAAAKHDYSVTNVAKIPGTPVTTGTAHHLKDDTYSTPSFSYDGEHSGDATYFTPDVGACGVPNASTDYIVAVSHLLYDSFPSQGGNPNTNAVCGKKIFAEYKGRNVTVTVTDRCEGCEMDSLDFTESAFKKLGNTDEGRLHGMTWTFI